MNQNFGSHGFSSAEEKKLELRLGPPGEDDFYSNNGVRKNNSKIIDGSLLSLGSFTTSNAKMLDLKNGTSNTAMANTSQKRSAQTPLVGWPPVRSFRKNLSVPSSSKPVSQSENEVVPNSNKMIESCKKGLFVKINMDGVPIGRKVDLKAYNSYENLSLAVDDLFRGLLAAQRDSPVEKNRTNSEEKAITGLLDGTGEYAFVYEDNEGDRMLVGDVPWNMFVTTVKRLRVLKSSDLSALTLGNKQGKTTAPT